MARSWSDRCELFTIFSVNGRIRHCCQGVLGSLLIKLNISVALYRRNSYIKDWPVLEVVCVSALTAGFSYLVSAYFFLSFFRS